MIEGYNIKDILSKEELRDLVWWKQHCKGRVEELKFEHSMISRYATARFYQQCRNMTEQELWRRYWRVGKDWEYYDIQIEEADRKLYLNMITRQAVAKSNTPYTDLPSWATFEQQSLF